MEKSHEMFRRLEQQLGFFSSSVFHHRYHFHITEYTMHTDTPKKTSIFLFLLGIFLFPSSNSKPQQHVSIFHLFNFNFKNNQQFADAKWRLVLRKLSLSFFSSRNAFANIIKLWNVEIPWKLYTNTNLPPALEMYQASFILANRSLLNKLSSEIIFFQICARYDETVPKFTCDRGGDGLFDEKFYF